jgi:hypothetical protein
LELFRFRCAERDLPAALPAVLGHSNVNQVETHSTISVACCRCGMVRHGAAWCGMVRHGAAWCAEYAPGMALLSSVCFWTVLTE